MSLLLLHTPLDTERIFSSVSGFLLIVVSPDTEITTEPSLDQQDWCIWVEFQSPSPPDRRMTQGGDLLVRPSIQSRGPQTTIQRQQQKKKKGDLN